MTAKIIIAFKRLSDSKLLTKALEIFAAMKENPHFPAPTPTLPALNDAIPNYQSGISASAGRDRTQVVLKNRSRVILIGMLKQLGNYITFTANGDSGMLGTCGYDLRKSPEPIIISKPTLLLNNGPNSGEVVIRAKTSKKIKGVVHQYTPDPLTHSSRWNSFPGTSRKYTAEGLERAKIYWFKVGVMGAKGQLVFSDSVSWVIQ